MRKTESGAPTAGSSAGDRAAAEGSVIEAEADGDSTPGDHRVELPTRRQLRLQQVGGKAVAPEPDEPVRDLKEPLPGGRRDRRLQYTASMAAVQARGAVPVQVSPRTPASAAGSMDIEEALAARSALAEAAKEHAGDVAARGSDDPFSVDPEMLSRQTALAERAAALNIRARQARERSARVAPISTEPQDPAAPHNLSFITPPELVRVPGSNQTALRAPSTSLIPVVIPRAAQSAEAGWVGTESEPIGARSAFGLDPLDAMTAGLRRLRRVRYLQYSILGVGAAALTTGIIMIVSSLNG